MALHNDIGDKGEILAVEYLSNNGYAILETNWRFRKSEIDIIVQKDNNIVFVEVKTRTSTYFQKPEEAINLKKQKQIFIAANEYVSRFKKDIDVRFDIISVVLKKEEENITHIKDAFYPII